MEVNRFDVFLVALDPTLAETQAYLPEPLGNSMYHQLRALF